MRDWTVASIAITLVLVVAGMGGGQWVRAQDGYPVWFQSMPRAANGTLWSVGYAPAYAEVEDGIKDAKADAYESLRRTHRVIILGEKLYESAPGYSTAFQGGNFVETGLPDTLHSVSYVDSLTAAGMTLVLATSSPDGTSSIPQVGERVSFSQSPPSWVRQEVQGTHPGGRTVGIAPRYYNEENCWRLAEKRARRKLAFEEATKVERLDKRTEAWRHDVRRMTTAVHLRRVQVRARWADDENCYVLTQGNAEEVLID